VSGAGDCKRDRDAESRIAAARQGSSEALGQLLEVCRDYLLLVATQEFDPKLQAKVGPSDLVQETFLRAHRDFGQFQGRTQDEFRAWLRRILLHYLANVGKQYRATAKREAGREVSWDENLAAADKGPVAPGESPSADLVAQEEDAALLRALPQLPAEYREVIRLRFEERLPFEEIGHCLTRTSEAARKLFARAVERLNELLKESNDDRP
jgi:RNA polymerase sigma-70 factor (ECF subfamily)